MATILFYRNQKIQKFGRIGAPGGPFGFFNVHCCKNQKLKRDPLSNKIFRKFCNDKKMKGGILWDFSTSILSQNSKKLKEGPLVSPGIVCYAEKMNNLFGSVP